MSIAYVNGAFTPLHEARVSVLDRGFLFADAVYEVIPAYAGSLFRLPQHLQRLDNSLRALLLDNPHDDAGWTALLRELVERNGGGDLAVYLQVTRGAQAQRDHVLPESPQATVVIFCQPLRGMSDEVRRRGVATVTRDDPRWRDCHIKSTALLPNVLVRHQAGAEGATEALLIRDGELMEGSSSNVFVVLDGVIVTPPRSRHILPGITRDVLLELIRAQDIAHAEQGIPVEALAAAEEIWLTSSTREVVPVTRVDGKPVGDGVPGPLWGHVLTLLQTYKEAPPSTLQT